MDRHQFFSEFLTPAGKMVIASVAGFGAFLADVTADLPKAEDYTVKGILIVAVIWLVRQMANERKEHRDDAEKRAADYKVELDERCHEASMREEKMTAALDANSRALEALKASTDNQTGYFKTVAQTIITNRIGKLPLPADGEN